MNEFQQQILQKIEQIASKLQNYKINNEELLNEKQELKAKIEYLERRESELVHPIAIAEDQAFHFKYQETKELLERNGMPTITWKPLENEQIPKEAKGLIIPGGFPEQHANQLSNSKTVITQDKTS